MALYVTTGFLVFALSGVMAMVGLGTALLVIPALLALGVPLAQATPTALLLNVVSLLFATVAYTRAHLVDWRVGIPVLVAAVVLAPAGARLTADVDKDLLRGMFAAFLVFAGWMMLFGKRRAEAREWSRERKTAAGASIGGVAGFMGGLLGVGGGNLLLPVLNWIGLDAKVAAGTTALVVVFSSLSGFLGHVTLGDLDRGLLAVGAVAAAGGSLLGAWFMRERIPSAILRRVTGVLLWAIAAAMVWGLIA